MPSDIPSSQPAVLVVGAGPVGLTLASELMRRGVACRIVDAKAAPATTSRALGVHARTLEVFQHMGVLDAIAAQSRRVNHFTVREQGRRLAVFDLDYTGMDTPFDASYFIAQADTEAALRARLVALGGRVEWGVTLHALTQDGAGVTASLEDATGRTHELRVDWLVGCDGGHSVVRKLLELPFEGAADETWLVVDALMDWDLPTDSIQMLRSSEGAVVAFPFPEPRRWRLLDTAPGETQDDAEIAAQFSRKLSEALRTEIVAPPLLWASRFTIQQRAVGRLRVGRCFLAGDAAHVHSPASGQGMNTGIQDAFNLAWKLTLVEQGAAPDALLDSYDAERRPVAHALLRGALRGTRLLSPRSQAIRRFGGRVLQAAMRVEPVRRMASRRVARGLSGLPISYRTSPAVAEYAVTVRDALLGGRERFGLRDWFAARRGPHAGDRVPDVVFGSGAPQERLFDALERTRHTLLLFTGVAPTGDDVAALARLATETQARYGAHVAVKLVVIPNAEAAMTAWDGDILRDPTDALSRRFGARTAFAYLIRPDWYVGFRSPAYASDALRAYLNALFEESALTTHPPRFVGSLISAVPPV